jgi:hypothetical protein
MDVINKFVLYKYRGNLTMVMLYDEKIRKWENDKKQVEW